MAAEHRQPGQTVDVHAPQGPLGLVFERSSTVLSRVKDSSPLLHKVQVGWTLVSVDGQDVSRMDGWAATKVISARVHDPDGRMLKFKTGEALPAAPRARGARDEHGGRGRRARARTSIEEQPVVGEVVTSPTSSEHVVDAEPVSPAPASPASDLTDEQRAALAAFAEMDTDGDGELSADEIHRALSKKNEDVSLARVKELVAKADTDGNGLVSKREYLDAIAANLVPQGWLGALGRGLARLTARAEPTGPVTIDAAAGSLGLVFQRESTVIMKVLATSPLLNKVKVGWTLVSLNDFEVVDPTAGSSHEGPAVAGG